MEATGDDLEEERLLGGWRTEQSRPVAGWDFSHLQGRMDEDHPPCDLMRPADGRWNPPTMCSTWAPGAASNC